jgi:hypothetical protein
MSLIVACSGNSSNYGTQYDVTETGVVSSALDPSGGQFEEPVQASPDWLEIRIGPERQAVYLPKTTDPPDLSYYHFGRSGVRYPTLSTQVGVELRGLDWHTGDNLQLVTPNAGTAIHDFEIHVAYPGEGATALTGEAMDWRAAQAPLVDAAAGDRTWIAQMSQQPLASGGHYHVLSRIGLAPDFTPIDGGAALLRASLAPVPLDRTLALTWKGTAYAALVAEAGPYARRAATPALSLRTLPQPLFDHNNFHNRFFMYLPSLVDFGPVDANTDVTHSIAYGNPFSTPGAPWHDFLAVVYSMPIAIPDGGVTYAMDVQAIPVETLAAGGAVEPTISPVEHVTIGGVSADLERTGVGTSPTIAWDPPALGTASTYTVTVLAIRPVGVGKTVTAVGTFYTTATSIRLPDSAMRDVGSYVLNIAAISARGRDLAAAPFLAAVPYASAEHVTAKLTP